MKRRRQTPKALGPLDLRGLHRVRRNLNRLERIRALRAVRDFLDANIANLYIRMEPNPYADEDTPRRGAAR